MTCNNCGNKEAWHLKSGFNGVTLERYEACDACGLQGAGQGIPDVYLPRSGMKFQNLTDKMGSPIEIRSKRHKKEVMASLGVSEAGGTFNGAPFGTKSWIDGTREYRRQQFEKERPKIREIHREWRERTHK